MRWLPIIKGAVIRSPITPMTAGALRTITAPSHPNRIYQHAAQTDRLGQSLAISSLPTIGDLFASHGLQGRYYYTDVPTLALWQGREGPRWMRGGPHAKV